MSNNKNLAVITSFGGINASGRSSDHMGYGNQVFDSLKESDQVKVLQDLAILQGVIKHSDKKWMTDTEEEIDLNSFLNSNQDRIRQDSMVRKIDREIYDPDGIILDQIKAGAAGQLPSGFDPAKLYPSRQHPKALQMTIFGMSDAMGQLGIDWSEVEKEIDPDELAVFSGSAMSNLDKFGFGCMMQSRLKGSRASSKNLAFGLIEMSADFINAYMLGNVGRTGHSVGACATFLYNLQLAKELIEKGECKVAVVGSAEAPITPEIFDGFYAVSALSDNKKMIELQSQLGEDSREPNYRKACRPFGDNIGMVLGESAQFIILMNEELAIKLGAEIYGSIVSVHSHADGYKSSISGPGIGNYITLAKCASDAHEFIGIDALKQRTFVHAHGTGTPANRTTESHIINKIAKAFDIESWPVTGLKSYLGHSMAVAAGDQLMSVLGTWSQGVIPGIHSVKEPAKDVYRDNLDILTENKVNEPSHFIGAFLNAKGFGGNNASAFIVNNPTTLGAIENRYSKEELKSYKTKLENTRSNAKKYNSKVAKGSYDLTYKFNHNVLTGFDDIEITKSEIKLKGYNRSIPLSKNKH